MYAGGRRVEAASGRVRKVAGNELARAQGDCLGAATSDAISARSNFGLGFALTHTLIKSDESHHRKFTSLSISSAFPG